MSEPTIVQSDPNIEQVVYNGLSWINIEKPTSRETEYLAQNYPFHPLDLDDCLSRIQRPKIDEYDDYLFIVLHFPLFSTEARVTVPSQVSIFISKNYLVTLHAGALKPLVKLFRDCELNEETRQENMKSTGVLLYRIVDRLIDYCLPITNRIMANLDKVENDIFDTKGRGTVKEISILRRDIISFRRVIWPLRAVVGTLERKTERFTREDLEVYWGDAIDHIDKIWDTLDECKEIIEGLKDTNDSLYSHHTTEVMRVLTIIATIMMPLTLVASFYGMNISLPGEDKDTTYIIIFLIMLVVIGTMLYFFHRRRWI
ncbi:magnesium/cobalt transporter CorA [Chloroflexota bacterium]